jgi:hypothetical protein
VNPALAIAVAVADVRTRLRRPSTGILILVAAVLAWLAIPDPSAGMGLMRVGGVRTLHTSPTVALVTATLLGLVLSLAGFYLVSNTLARDLRTRMATVVAATPVRNVEYLLGKLAGNVAVLVVVTAGAMAAAMAMQVVRGEGPLEPSTYLLYYALLLAPCVAWAATLALAFECAPGLAGAAGDVLYFFVWMLAIPLSIEPWRKVGAPISWFGQCFDFIGIGFVRSQVERLYGRADIAIGYGPADVTRTPIQFPGLDTTWQAVGTRAWAFAIPLLLLPVALALFRRFDPARTRPLGADSQRSLAANLAALSRPVARPILGILDRVSPDAALTFRARPTLVLLAAASAALGIVLPTASVRQGLLPALFAVLSGALADVATRERQVGLATIVFATPRHREGFAVWKLLTAALVALILGGVPGARLLFAEPRSGLSALVGLLFLAATSVALGIATGTTKAFTFLSLALWYVALNGKGQGPALDYGGWWAAATPLTQAGWAAATMVAAATAVAAHRARIAAEGWRSASRSQLANRPRGGGR